MRPLGYFLLSLALSSVSHGDSLLQADRHLELQLDAPRQCLSLGEIFIYSVTIHNRSEKSVRLMPIFQIGADYLDIRMTDSNGHRATVRQFVADIEGSLKAEELVVLYEGDFIGQEFATSINFSNRGGFIGLHPACYTLQATMFVWSFKDRFPSEVGLPIEGVLTSNKIRICFRQPPKAMIREQLRRLNSMDPYQSFNALDYFANVSDPAVVDAMVKFLGPVDGWVERHHPWAEIFDGEISRYDAPIPEKMAIAVMERQRSDEFLPYIREFVGDGYTFDRPIVLESVPTEEELREPYAAACEGNK